MALELRSLSRALLRRGPPLALGLLLASAGGGAGAQQLMYMCRYKDHTYTGSLPPPECKDQDLRELNPDGTLHRLIPAPLTPEQRRAQEAAEKERQLREEQANAQRHQDRSLLETYGSVSEIESARDRAVAAREVLVKRADERIAQYARERKHLDEEAEFYVKRALPAKLKDAYAANQALSDQQEKTKADVLNEIHALQARYEAQIKRYLELEKMAEEAAALRARESGATQPRDDN